LAGGKNPQKLHSQNNLACIWIRVYIDIMQPQKLGKHFWWIKSQKIQAAARKYPPYKPFVFMLFTLMNRNFSTCKIYFTSQKWLENTLQK
jgi:hypothetical protein